MIKKNGEFFLFGEGVPMTTYAESASNSSWTGRRSINPLAAKLAYDWAMEELSASEFEEILSTISEDEANYLLSITVPENVFISLKSMATANEKKISEIITELVIGKS